MLTQLENETLGSSEEYSCQNACFFNFFRVTGREVHNWDWGTSDVCEKNSVKCDFKPKVHFVIKLVGRFRKWVFLYAGCLRITRALHLESKTAGMQNYFLCLFHRGHIKPFGPHGVFLHQAHVLGAFWASMLTCWLVCFQLEAVASAPATHHDFLKSPESTCSCSFYPWQAFIQDCSQSSMG